MRLNIKKGQGASRRFVPNKTNVAAYLLLTTSGKQVSVEDVVVAAKVSHSRGSAAMTQMFKAGLLKRRKTLNNEHRYWWEPEPRAKELAIAIADAAEDLAKASPTSKAAPEDDLTAVAAEFERWARLLEKAARHLRKVS